MSKKEKKKGAYNKKAAPADVNYEYLQLPGGSHKRIFQPEDKIAYIRADRAYCKIHLLDKPNIPRTETLCLREIMERLNPFFFFRGHNSFIYCWKNIKCFRYKDDYIVVGLKSGEEFNISEPYVAVFETLRLKFPDITEVSE